jgi:chromosome segregation ATPase
MKLSGRRLQIWSLTVCFGLLGLGLLGSAGCGARAEVAKDKVLAQLDKVLGELNVKEKQIDIKRRELTGEMQVVREKKFNAAVRLELLTKKQDSSKQELEKLKQGLARVQPKMEEAKVNGKIELNGREVTADELNRMATDLINRVKSKESELGSQKTSIDALKRSADFLASQEKAAADMLGKLDLKISEIKDKKIAIDAVKSATSMVGNDTSINDKINSLSKEIDNMFVDVETAMRVEEAKLNELQNQTMSADELLTETGSDLDATMSEIDAILGKGGGN